MLLIYNFFTRFYLILIFISSFFNEKAKLWLSGRRQQKLVRNTHCIWFHFASLGEFEQGRPVLEALKKITNYPIVITFFSPSGYEAKKNSPLANQIYYLPMDNATKSAHFIDTINPVVAIFTKYEYWYHYFSALNERNIPLYVVSGIFRPKHIFFKWYGGLHRKILSFVSHFFVQDEQSLQLLKKINVCNVTVSGDTRFDRVWQNACNPKSIGLVEQFKAGSKIFIGGSTWPADEELIVTLLNEHPEWKFIFAPHEISEAKITALMKLLPVAETLCFSEIADAKKTISAYRILIIDNIGMLSSLYQYAEIAYIGGGFGVGIHNTLEAAAFGLPVIFGSNYLKFNEARDFVRLKLGFSIANAEQLKAIANTLITDKDLLNHTQSKIKDYVQAHTGATNQIVEYIVNQTDLGQA